MSIKRIMKGLPSEKLPAAGLMFHDKECLTPCQRDCISRLGMSIQMEQEAYMSHHPEVMAMQEVFLGKMALAMKRKDMLKEANEYFTRPVEELEKDIRNRLGIPENGPYMMAEKPKYSSNDNDLIKDLNSIVLKHYPPEPWNIESSERSPPNTPSSSFVSLITSDSTVLTPEPIPTPSPTMSANLFAAISYTVDKAIFLHVDDRLLRYDTAYVMLMNCVEEAMEIPVREIKEDIGALLYNAFKMFEIDILEKERVAAEMAWEKRMRKKLKRTLRRADNFKGYETPPTPKSEISSHESYKKPPPRPCICHPQFNYNRYPKDRFGIYLPSETKFSEGNLTVTPVISLENLVGELPDDDQVND